MSQAGRNPDPQRLGAQRHGGASAQSTVVGAPLLALEPCEESPEASEAGCAGAPRGASGRWFGPLCRDAAFARRSPGWMDQQRNLAG